MARLLTGVGGGKNYFGLFPSPDSDSDLSRLFLRNQWRGHGPSGGAGPQPRSGLQGSGTGSRMRQHLPMRAVLLSDLAARQLYDRHYRSGVSDAKVDGVRRIGREQSTLFPSQLNLAQSLLH